MAVEIPFDVAAKGRLVILHAQHVVSIFVHDFLRDGRLGADGVCGDHIARNIQHVKKFRDGDDLVLLFVLVLLPVKLELGDHHPVLVGPGAEDVDGERVVRHLARATDGLAVNADSLPLHLVRHGGHPAHEAAVKHLLVNELEKPVESVVRRDAVGQVQPFLEEFPPLLAEVRDVLPSPQPA